MAHIPMSDIEELWNGSNHSWSGLRPNLEQRRGKAEGISNTLVVDMTRYAEQEEKAGHPFPSSAQQLYNEMNRKLQTSGSR